MSQGQKGQVPQEIGALANSFSQRIQSRIEKDLAPDFDKCYQQYSNDITGFEKCSATTTQRVRSFGQRLDSFNMFFSMRVSDCLANTRDTKECVKVASNILNDFERGEQL